jgi:hypothetical protein
VGSDMNLATLSQHHQCVFVSGPEMTGFGSSCVLDWTRALNSWYFPEEVLGEYRFMRCELLAQLAILLAEVLSPSPAQVKALIYAPV